MVDPAQEPVVHLPLLVRFAIVMAIFLFIPPICRRVRIPPGVGLLLAGVALGPSGLHTLPNAAPVAMFFAEIGKLLLMFFAGLEIDLAQFRRTGRRSLAFGGLTFSIPFVVGIGVGLLAGYSWIAAKFLAARLTQRIFAYSRSQGRLIWSLSLPQVAATLAPAIVAYETKDAAGVRLIDEPVLNTIL